MANSNLNKNQTEIEIFKANLKVTKEYSDNTSNLLNKFKQSYEEVESKAIELLTKNKIKEEEIDKLKKYLEDIDIKYKKAKKVNERLRQKAGKAVLDQEKYDSLRRSDFELSESIQNKLNSQIEGYKNLIQSESYARNEWARKYDEEHKRYFSTMNDKLNLMNQISELELQIKTLKEMNELNKKVKPKYIDNTSQTYINE